MGVYQHCSDKHLHRYVAEFEFRYNNRSAVPDKFKGAARELECDDDEAHFDEQLKKLVKHKQVRKPE